MIHLSMPMQFANNKYRTTQTDAARQGTAYALSIDLIFKRRAVARAFVSISLPPFTGAQS
jgi:hypothetical protein